MSPDIEAVLSGSARWALVCADNSEVLPGLPDKSVGHVITDPPYSEHVHGKSRRGQSLPDGAKKAYRSKANGAACSNRSVDLGFVAITDTEVNGVAGRFGALAGRWVLVFCDLESTGRWMSGIAGAGLDHVRIGVWVKGNATPQFTGDRPASGAEAVVISHRKGRKKWNGGGAHAIWSHTVVRPFLEEDGRVHTTQKPISLMLELVELFTDEDDIVLDPFAGSGTTGVACLRLGRRFIGIERDEKYAAVARQRLEAETQGMDLRSYRNGQRPLFGETP